MPRKRSAARRKSASPGGQEIVTQETTRIVEKPVVVVRREPMTLARALGGVTTAQPAKTRRVVREVQAKRKRAA
jgi:hypothetical protein